MVTLLFSVILGLVPRTHARLALPEFMGRRNKSDDDGGGRAAVAGPLALLVLLLAACSQAPGLERLAAGESGRVAEVRSGDSLVLASGLAVRLAGVEAPWGAEPYAAEARSALQRIVAGRTVQLLYGGARRNRYGSALAQTRIVGGPWLEQALLRAGAARVRTWADNRAMAAPMLEAEAYARNRRLGLWALPAYRVLVPGEAVNAEGFQVVEGRVRRVGGGEAVTLDFDAGFSAEIASSALADFNTAGKAPPTLVGRLIRIRGPIRYGPLRLDHPEQVEVLKG
jgi:endonuclease YncB( thermonuclease family)